MKRTNDIKTIFLFLLTFLLGAQTTYAKTEVMLPQNQEVFTVEQNQEVNTLKKQVQPNIGFLKEKTKFVAVQRSSAVNSYNFSESFVENLANGVDDLLDAIYNTQKGIINKYKGSISNASRNGKGVFGEVATDVKFTENGFEALHIRKGQNGDLLDGWGETGIDHIYKKIGEYYIVDSKYGSAQLNANTIDGKQMSDPWITGSNRLKNLVGVEIAEDIIDSGYKRILSTVSDDGTIVLKELDEFANKIGDFNF